jgi:hypothetical protein
MSGIFPAPRSIVLASLSVVTAWAVAAPAVAGTNPSESTVIATDELALGNGTDSGEITVTLVDTQGSARSGASVRLNVVFAENAAAVSGVGQSAATDANGRVVFAVGSSIPQLVVFEAEVLSDELTLPQLAAVEFYLPDLVAGPITIQAAGQFTTLTFAYTVDSPEPVGNYSIRLGIDRNGDGQIDGAIATVAGSTTPDLHNVALDVRAAMDAFRMLHGDRVIAVLDSGNVVHESDEGNNLVASSNLRVDLVANLISIERVSLNGYAITVSYTVDSPGAVAPFFISLAVDSNLNGTIDSGELFDTVPAPHTTPGGQFEVIGAFSDALIAAGAVADQNARILAVIDSGNVINEADETNNARFEFTFVEQFPPVAEPAATDSDGDGLTNAEEVGGIFITRYAGTSGRFDAGGVSVELVQCNPQAPDTDGDGISDWDEMMTSARAAEEDGSVPSVGLPAFAPRANRIVLGPDGQVSDLPQSDVRRSMAFVAGKPVYGVRTDPTRSDTDADGIADTQDAAPQISPPSFGFSPTDPVIQQLRADLNLTDEAAFQAFLTNFDQDGDGFLEAPDTDGDGIPDFSRYNEAILEQLFFIDFSNDGSLDDGFDVGARGLGGSSTIFGTYRVRRGGDGTIDVLDTGGGLPRTDNCPQFDNADQLDFDLDGLGNGCDLDADNDGVPNDRDPVLQEPIFGGAPQCGFGAGLASLAGFCGLVAARARCRKK